MVSGKCEQYLTFNTQKYTLIITNVQLLILKITNRLMLKDGIKENSIKPFCNTLIIFNNNFFNVNSKYK